MRSRNLRDGVYQGVQILVALPIVLTVLLAGCVWRPDFVPASPSMQHLTVLKESVVKHTPFTITRTLRILDGDIKADFQWEARGWADWFDEFGFGTTATYIRFVLFGPDRSIICGNVWQESSKVTATCVLKKEHLGKGLDADLDYTFDPNPPGEHDFYMTAGRMFIFEDKGNTGNPLKNE
ncbi:MAG TPA: hypothetical protein VE177_08385 [Candidatus Binatus sp.]|nr:hypothetical protein [Candidatus Binatus sp.]